MVEELGMRKQTSVRLFDGPINVTRDNERAVVVGGLFHYTVMLFYHMQLSLIKP